MSVGIVIVSHSAALAAGVVALAREMGGEAVRIEPAGGLEDPPDALGTDAERVRAAIERAATGDGVLVLMDLGSALMSAEMATEMLDGDGADVLLSPAPLVEGAVAAAAAARGGGSLAEVAAEARGALRPKAEQLQAAEEDSAAGAGDGLAAAEDGSAAGVHHPAAAEGDLAAGEQDPAAAGGDPAAGEHDPTAAEHDPTAAEDGLVAAEDASTGTPAEVLVRLENRLGLHARPAARLVGIASEHEAELTVANVTTGRGPTSARSLTGLALLGARGGHELRVRASGHGARAALDAVLALAADGFGDGTDPAAAPVPPGTAAPAPPPAEAESRALVASAPSAGTVLGGVAASSGIASGPARRLRPAVVRVPDTPAEDPAAEAARLDAALDAVREELRATRERMAARVGDSEADVFAAQALMLADDALLIPAREAIATQGRTAARAFHLAAEEVAAGYEALDDAYLRERATDVRDVARRVLARLTRDANADPAAAPSDDPAAAPSDDPAAAPPDDTAPRPATAPGILIADELTPGEAAELDPARVAGVATARGSATAHAAILARSLGLPAVVGLGDAVLAVPDGTELLLDGEAGTVAIEPPAADVRAARVRQAAWTERRAAARARAHEPARTRDGVLVEVAANLGATAEAAEAVALGADGVGLLRTEFLFLGRASLPDEDEQAAAYAEVAAALEGRPLVIRTLDVGADKPLPGVPQPPEANPFLGERGIRLSLARPELAAPQFRALARVARAHPNVRVMFPMVATVAEYRAARAALEGAGAPPELEVGVMVEVPSVALQAERFAREVDFFSIGTNDLAQYTMAAERGNARLAALADGPLPPLLALVAAVVDGARAHGRWVGVCGELAADPDAVGLLVGLGVTELSVAPPLVAEVKARVRELDAAEASAVGARAVEAEDAAAARALATPNGPAEMPTAPNGPAEMPTAPNGAAETPATPDARRREAPARQDDRGVH